jgi:hypothetical protein
MVRIRASKWLKTALLTLTGTGIVLAAVNLPANAPDIVVPVGHDELVLPNEESLFAEIDENGQVLRVIVADVEVIKSGRFGDPANWVRTYSDGKRRGSYAGKGHTYDRTTDTFIPPTP